MITKSCSRCKKYKPLGDFPSNKKAKDKKDHRCRPCLSDYQAIRRMNPEIKKRDAENHTLYMRKWCKDPHNYTAQRTRIKNNQTLKALINNFDKVKEETVRKLLGIDKQGFMDHLESLFEPGMSWKNYGAWHLDHKTNLSEFNLLDPKVLKKANHYLNIRPMWATGKNGNLTRRKPHRVYY